MTDRNEMDQLAEVFAGKLKAALVRAEVREEQARLILDAIDRLDWSQEPETQSITLTSEELAEEDYVNPVVRDANVGSRRGGAGRVNENR